MVDHKSFRLKDLDDAKNRVIVNDSNADTVDFVIEYEGEWQSIDEYTIDGATLFIWGGNNKPDHNCLEYKLEQIDKWKLKMAGFYDKKYHKQGIKRITSKAYYSRLIKCC